MANPRFTNQLIHETSPYLLQHAHNPVNWHAWNEDTLQKARSLNKLLLISVGYSACHWCHVMEKESFENENVARIMNEHFICIKVDREERPDVDQVYMEAVQMITGSGGWPLNCFALPDGKPFFGGTYFRKEQWVNLLENIALLFESRKEDVVSQANELTRELQDKTGKHFAETQTAFKFDHAEKMAGELRKRFDTVNGGTTGSPKFPMPVLTNFLLRYYYHTGDHEIWEQVKLTLGKMASGGIFDHLGGGFARYSTDSRWKVPHFEKMLYDNAQLISLYSNAFLISGEPLFKETVRKTLQFINDEMTHPDGGFYSALDADSEGEEGKYYLWKSEEVREILGKNSDLFIRFYQVDGEGLWESGDNILIRQSSMAEMARSLKIERAAFRKHIRHSEKLMLAERKKRVRPSLDDKIITSWNAMMTAGYLDAFRVFREPKYLKRALNNYRFIREHLTREDGGLWHTWKEGKAQINGFLDDYAFVIRALIKLYQAEFHEEYLAEASRLTEYVIRNFYDEADMLFYFTSGLDPALVARKKETQDTVVPSSNSVMAENLFLLSEYLQREEFLSISSGMISRMAPLMDKYPGAYTNWGTQWINRARPFYSVVVAGESFQELLEPIYKKYLPNTALSGSAGGSGLPLFDNRFIPEKTRIYICSGSYCKKPVERTSDALKLIEKE